MSDSHKLSDSDKRLLTAMNTLYGRLLPIMSDIQSGGFPESERRKFRADLNKILADLGGEGD